MITHVSKLRLMAAAALMALAGCDSGSGPVEQTGFLSLGISDGPIDADKVCIAFTGVELKGQGAPFMVDVGEADVPDVVNINLITVPGDNAAPLLSNEEIPAGEYQWLRLAVNAEVGGTGGTGDDPTSVECVGDASYVSIGGTPYNLYIPSGAESGLKFVNGITIPATVPVAYTAEFDLMLSMKEPIVEGEDAKMRPTVRLVNNIEVGTLTGDVDSGLVDGCPAPADDSNAPGPMVFVFNDGVTPNAIEAADAPADDNDPVATAKVETLENLDGTTSYDYTVGFLPEGNYEAAFTCDGTEFQPREGKPVTIRVGEVTTVPFP